MALGPGHLAHFKESGHRPDRLTSFRRQSIASGQLFTFSRAAAACLAVSIKAVALTINMKPLPDTYCPASGDGAGTKKIVSSISFGSKPAIFLAHSPTSSAHCKGKIVIRCCDHLRCGKELENILGYHAKEPRSAPADRPQKIRISLSFAVTSFPSAVTTAADSMLKHAGPHAPMFHRVHH